jgi:cbb3-type cytochrome oxidase subunit 1
MTFLSGFMFMAKMCLLALIVETAMVAIMDIWGSDAQQSMAPPEGLKMSNGDPAYDGTSILAQLQLYGHYMTAFILLAGVVGMIIQAFKPESRDYPVKYRYR